MGKVAVVMGSTSDLPVMEEAVAILKEFGIVVDVDIVSAHRTPDKLVEFRKSAHLERLCGDHCRSRWCRPSTRDVGSLLIPSGHWGPRKKQ